MSLPEIHVDASSRPRRSDNPSVSVGARDTSLETPTSVASSRRRSDNHLLSTTGVSHRSPASVGQAEIAPMVQFGDASSFSQPEPFTVADFTPQPSLRPRASTGQVEIGPMVQFGDASSFPQLERFTVADFTPRSSLRSSSHPREKSYLSFENLPVEFDISSLPMPLENGTAHKDQKFEVSSDLPEPVILPGITSPAHPSASSGIDISSLSINQPQSLGTSLAVHSRRVSDVSSVSVDDDHSEPYDIRNETAPVAPFFSSVFQDALKEGFEIAKSSTAAIGKLDRFINSGSHGERLLADGKQLSAFRCSDSRTIALLGDSGEGDTTNRKLPFAGIIANFKKGKAVL